MSDQQYTPDVGQIIAPDGTVTYDFDAHLHARGIDIDIATGKVAPNDRRVRWLLTDGSAAGELWAYRSTQIGGPNYQHGTLMRAGDGPDEARITVATDTAAGGSIQAQVVQDGATHVATILDGFGGSDFVLQHSAPIPWEPFPGAGGWAAYGPPFQAPQCMRDELGRVHLRGLLRNMAGWVAGAVAGTLPAELAPPAQLIFVTSSAAGVTRLDIDTAGNVIPATAGAPGAYLSLDGISFSTDPTI